MSKATGKTSDGRRQMDSDDERDGEDDGKDDVILSLSLFRPLAIRPFCERKVQWRNCFKA